jgi:hypothetical protein
MLPEAIKPRQSRDKKRRSRHQPEGEQTPLLTLEPTNQKQKVTGTRCQTYEA